MDGFSSPEYIKILSIKNYTDELMDFDFDFFGLSGLIDYFVWK